MHARYVCGLVWCVYEQDKTKQRNMYRNALKWKHKAKRQIHESAMQDRNRKKYSKQQE